MIEISPGIFITEQELEFTAVRSSGPGGQHVNKTSTKVVLRFDIKHSPGLPEPERQILLRRLASRLTVDGVLLLSSQESRSQLTNRERVRDRLVQLLRAALKPEKPRTATSIPKSSKLARLDEKRRRAAAKTFRRKPSGDE